MTTRRRNHTATLLPGGKVLVVGGYDDTITAANGEEVLASAELYDPGTGSWTATGKMATQRVAPTATLLPDGQVLVAGGLGSAAIVAELYDPANGSWTEAGSPPGDVLTATLLPDGTVLVTFCCRHAELYDPGAGSWTATARQSTDIGNGTTATLLPDGTVLEAGGEGRGADFASAELYHPASPATSHSSPAPTAGLVGSEPGTVGVTVGDHFAGFAGVICRGAGKGQLSVRGGDPNDGEWFALVLGSDGAVSSLSGALRGVEWKVTQKPQLTLKADKSGTFSGKDVVSGADVSGTFAC